jgi:hypothetical protein
MKLKKLISRLNKENEPPDGWRPEDKVQATSKKKQARIDKQAQIGY